MWFALGWVCGSRRPWSRTSASGSQEILPLLALDHTPETKSLTPL